MQAGSPQIQSYFIFVLVVIRDKISRSHVIIGIPEAIHYWMMKLQAVEPRTITLLVLDEASALLDSQQFRESTIGIYT